MPKLDEETKVNTPLTPEGLASQTQEKSVTEPQPGPGPVPAQESPPYDKTGPKYPPPGEGEWPPRDAVDAHPLTPEDTRRPEKPAGMSVQSRTYGHGGQAAARAEAQGKEAGQAPDVPNIPTGAIPVEGEDQIQGIDPSPPDPEAPIDALSAGPSEPPFKATPPTGTSEKGKDKK